MRVAVVDVGTNSTRLLVADVGSDGEVVELERRSRVTRLGDGVDATGRLGDDAIGRVLAVLDEYVAVIDTLGAVTRPAVLTSAVRDAANGADWRKRAKLASKGSGTRTGAHLPGDPDDHAH